MRPRLSPATCALAAVLATACSQPTAPPIPAIGANEAMAHIDEFSAAQALGDDPGGRGEAMAMQYAKNYFASLDLVTHDQFVPLVRMTPTCALLQVGVRPSSTAEDGGASEYDCPSPENDEPTVEKNCVISDGDLILDDDDLMQIPDDCYLIWSGQERPVATVSAGVVFAGYGIVSPEYTRDDYAEGADVTDKLVLVLEGSPRTADRDDLGLLGEALYGRPSYKYIEAARHGAAAVLIIHAEAESWAEASRIQNGSIVDIKPSDGELENHAIVEGLLSQPAARRLFELAGLDFDIEVQRARGIAFAPKALQYADSENAVLENTTGSLAPTPTGRTDAVPAVDITAEIGISSTIDELTSHDVIAVQPGQLPEWVMLSGRWNSLPFDPPAAQPPAPAAPGATTASAGRGGGSGAAVVMEIARRLTLQDRQPLRGVVYTVSTAMAEGIVGLQYYVDNPPDGVPLEQTVAHIFIDQASPFQEARIVGRIGTNAHQTLSHMAREATIRQKRLLILDQNPDRRFYYTYSESPFIGLGIPTVYLTTPAQNDRFALLKAPRQAGRPEGGDNRLDLDASLFEQLLTRVVETTNWPNPSSPLR